MSESLNSKLEQIRQKAEEIKRITATTEQLVRTKAQKASEMLRTTQRL